FLRSWLHALTYLRNVCAHHKRLWNRQFAIRPRFPSRSLAWPHQVPDNSRLYGMLVVLRHMLRAAVHEAQTDPPRPGTRARLGRLGRRLHRGDLAGPGRERLLARLPITEHCWTIRTKDRPLNHLGWCAHHRKVSRTYTSSSRRAPAAVAGRSISSRRRMRASSCQAGVACQTQRTSVSLSLGRKSLDSSQPSATRPWTMPRLWLGRMSMKLSEACHESESASPVPEFIASRRGVLGAYPSSPPSRSCVPASPSGHCAVALAVTAR